MTRDGCVYCGGRPLTVEHAMPQWVQARYPGVYRARGLDRPDVRDIKVRRVCGSCNNDWLNSTFEVPGQELLPPLFERQPLVLPPDVQTFVAAWATKTAFMLALADSTEPPPAEDYERLRLTDMPPPTVVVSAGTALPPVVEAEEQPPNDAALGEPPEPPIHPPLPSRRRVLGIGHLLLIVDHADTRWVEQVRDGVAGSSVGFPRLYPTTGVSILWPAIGRIETDGPLHYATR